VSRQYQFTRSGRASLQSAGYCGGNSSHAVVIKQSIGPGSFEKSASDFVCANSARPNERAKLERRGIELIVPGSGAGRRDHTTFAINRGRDVPFDWASPQISFNGVHFFQFSDPFLIRGFLNGAIDNWGMYVNCNNSGTPNGDISACMFHYEESTADNLTMPHT